MNDSLKQIKLLVLDVDGVLTDGGLHFSESGEHVKSFNSLDGAGIKIFQDCGFQVAIITGRNSPQVKARAENLGIKHVYMGIDEKLGSLKDLLEKTSVSEEEAAFIGDDLPDIPPMRFCKNSFAPANAVQEVLDMCTIRLSRKGGEGAVREAIELILKGRGLWDEVVSRY